MSMRLYRDVGDIGQFLINLFVLEVVGHWLVKGVLWFFRLFGMPQPWLWWQGVAWRWQWLFTVLLVVAVLWSVVRIILKARRREFER